MLDKALLRPGRFDRQIQVPLPTEHGHLEILLIHLIGLDWVWLILAVLSDVGGWGSTGYANRDRYGRRCV